jgi:hypothetical protein
MLRMRKVPRLVKGKKNHHRGVMNEYSLTSRGRERAGWWRRSHSMLAFDYLKSGVGEEREYFGWIGKEMVAMSAPPYALQWPIHDAGAKSALFYFLDRRTLPVYFFTGTMLAMLERFMFMKAQGIIPDEVVKDVPVYLSIAKGHGSSEDQIWTATLHRSAAYYKHKAEYWRTEVDTIKDDYGKRLRDADWVNESNQAHAKWMLDVERKTTRDAEFDVIGAKAKNRLQTDNFRDWIHENSMNLLQLKEGVDRLAIQSNLPEVGIIARYVSAVITVMLANNSQQTMSLRNK